MGFKALRLLVEHYWFLANPRPDVYVLLRRGLLRGFWSRLVVRTAPIADLILLSIYCTIPPIPRHTPDSTFDFLVCV